ncbi:MAG: hypothetical protein VXW65_03750 [Pseudomonadota bacterium]|nr:hypothetical protein [Pseudomonadota bacterium]
MTDSVQQPLYQRPDRKIQLYLTPAAWDALVRLMGETGRPSPTIQDLILAEDRKRNPDLYQ